MYSPGARGRNHASRTVVAQLRAGLHDRQRRLRHELALSRDRERRLWLRRAPASMRAAARKRTLEIVAKLEEIARAESEVLRGVDTGGRLASYSLPSNRLRRQRPSPDTSLAARRASKGALRGALTPALVAPPVDTAAMSLSLAQLVDPFLGLPGGETVSVENEDDRAVVVLPHVVGLLAFEEEASFAAAPTREASLRDLVAADRLRPRG